MVEAGIKKTIESRFRDCELMYGCTKNTLTALSWFPHGIVCRTKYKVTI